MATGSDLTLLIETIDTAARTDFALKRDILGAIKRMLNKNVNVLRIFRENNGFVSLVSTLVSLENGTVFTSSSRFDRAPTICLI